MWWRILLRRQFSRYWRFDPLRATLKAAGVSGDQDKQVILAARLAKKNKASLESLVAATSTVRDTLKPVWHSYEQSGETEAAPAQKQLLKDLYSSLRGLYDRVAEHPDLRFEVASRVISSQGTVGLLADLNGKLKVAITIFGKEGLVEKLGLIHQLAEISIPPEMIQLSPDGSEPVDGAAKGLEQFDKDRIDLVDAEVRKFNFNDLTLEQAVNLFADTITLADQAQKSRPKVELVGNTPYQLAIAAAEMLEEAIRTSHTTSSQTDNSLVLRRLMEAYAHTDSDQLKTIVAKTHNDLVDRLFPPREPRPNRLELPHRYGGPGGTGLPGQGETNGDGYQVAGMGGDWLMDGPQHKEVKAPLGVFRHS